MVLQGHGLHVWVTHIWIPYVIMVIKMLEPYLVHEQFILLEKLQNVSEQRMDGYPISG